MKSLPYYRRQQSPERLRSALAIGADRAILVESPADLEPLAVAKALQALVAKSSRAWLSWSKQSIDGDNNQTGQMLAALCDMPQGHTFASNWLCRWQSSGHREIDGGLETLSLSLRSGHHRPAFE